MNGQCCTQSTDEISEQNKSETNKQNKQAKKERKKKQTHILKEGKECVLMYCKPLSWNIQKEKNTKP